MHDKNPAAGTMTLSKEGMSLVLDVSKHVCQVTLNKLKSQLGMVSHKMSIISVFGHKHLSKNKIKSEIIYIICFVL